jgi:MFS family permease
MVFVLLVIQGLVFFQVMSTYPLYLHDVRGYSTRLVGMVLVVNAALVVLVEMPLVKRFERGNALALCGFASLLIGLGFGLLPLSGALGWVIFLMIIWSFGEMLVAPMMTAWVANRAPDQSRGAYMAAFGIAFSLCTAGAPFLGTLVYARAGPDTLWIGCLGVCVFVFLAFLALSRRDH